MVCDMTDIKQKLLNDLQEMKAFLVDIDKQEAVILRNREVLKFNIDYINSLLGFLDVPLQEEQPSAQKKAKQSSKNRGK